MNEIGLQMNQVEILSSVDHSSGCVRIYRMDWALFETKNVVLASFHHFDSNHHYLSNLLQLVPSSRHAQSVQRLHHPIWLYNLPSLVRNSSMGLLRYSCVAEEGL